MSYVKTLAIKLTRFYVDFAKKLKRKSEIIRMVNFGQGRVSLEMHWFDLVSLNQWHLRNC